MVPRIHLDRPLTAGDAFDLPAPQARHVQVLRLQPGAALTLFNGAGGEWLAHVVQMGRSAVGVQVDAYVEVDRELGRHVTLALGMPANERMDALVEKATELGAAVIQPLVCERSVLRLDGERAAKRLAHWRGVAIAASEQSGRTRLPQVQPVQSLRAWLEALGPAQPERPTQAAHPGHLAEPAQPKQPALPGASRRLLLSPDAPVLLRSTEMAGPAGAALLFLSGPEGGLSAAEAENAKRTGFAAVALGARVLRADTAPLVALAWCGFESQADHSL